MNLEETLDIDVEDLFKDPVEDTQENTKNDNEPDIMTKAVTERINSVRKKTENETKENIAKELGYDSYQDMQKANEKKVLSEAGLDEAEVSKVVTDLVEKRLQADPRFKKIEELEKLEKTKFVTNQLKEINELTGNNYISIEQLPEETLKLWEKTGNLKQAYLATEGESLLLKNKAKVNNGSLSHLASSSGNGVSTKTRTLTEAEKKIWRLVFPDMSEDDLSKKNIDIE